ncbi:MULTISPECIES: hypothetical protein [Sphingobacterium]|uniref:hypothetical protein n=1 Tax=Sphingobacterium TaxID=28453 RepID=UPI002167612B|nr:MULTISPECIES: hypothetical protein [Sphingobacterium]MCS4166267.1 hypothetical protein [Sphingobacterium sp. BIGb0116]
MMVRGGGLYSPNWANNVVISTLFLVKDKTIGCSRNSITASGTEDCGSIGSKISTNNWRAKGHRLHLPFGS